MAVQQLGRDQARTLTDIIRGVSNVGGGIDEALQVVPPGRKAQLLEAAGLQPQPDTQFPTAELLRV